MRTKGHTITVLHESTKIRQATDTGWSQDPEEMDQISKSIFT